MTCSSNLNGNQIYLSSSRVPARPLGVGPAAPAEPHRIEVDASPSELTLASNEGGRPFIMDLGKLATPRARMSGSYIGTHMVKTIACPCSRPNWFTAKWRCSQRPVATPP
jgi:hypothetical protein